MKINILRILLLGLFILGLTLLDLSNHIKYMAQATLLIGALNIKL